MFPLTLYWLAAKIRVGRAGQPMSVAVKYQVLCHAFAVLRHEYSEAEMLAFCRRLYRDRHAGVARVGAKNVHEGLDTRSRRLIVIP